MAQYRQSGFDRLTAGRGHDPVYVNGGIASSDHVSIGIRPSNKLSHRARRSVHKGGSGCCGGCCGGFARYVSFGTVVTVLCFVLALTAFVYVYISADKKGAEANNIGTIRYDDFKNDFLTNVSRINMSQVQFGHGSVSSGRDSRYWDRDDRRRDDDYEEEVMDESNEDKTVNSNHGQKGEGSIKKSTRSIVVQGTNSHSLYNEAGRDELKMYEEKYEESLKNFGDASTESEARNQESIDVNSGKDYNETDTDDDYDDAIDLHDVLMDEYEENRHGTADNEDFKHLSRSVEKDRNLIERGEGASSQSSRDRSFESHSADKLTAISNGRSTSSASGKRPKRHRFSCPLKLLNSTAQIVEPLESRKFMRFSLQYTVTEEKPDAVDVWEPRFAGHQSLREREESFVARDQKINCGFVKGPTGYPSTGFDLAEDDSRYMNKCHIAVISCIFGNSDRLRSPTGKTVSSLSKKNVCFVMFVDERTLQTLFAEGQMPDEKGFIGLWKVVVVKNLPYKDMRRVGKIPKLLPHRLFPSARYSIWLDSKLRLQRDPLLILEYFLWRKGNEFAISNHYDRHCVWEEVAQNKRLNKYNHAAIDQQFAFYQADGLKRFNRSDPKRPLPSYVPEGSFIVRAHTPMSNLFSCLWFNEVDRFTPRDQLSFAHTYLKLRKKNPEKPLYLHMFKDCERRTIAKLYHHRTEEKQNIVQKSSE